MKLYIYDHCPYCVKARMIFGYKNIPFKLIILLNDDEKTPLKMIGKKMVPILFDSGAYISESLDIIKKIDSEHGSVFISNALFDSRLEAWLCESRGYLYPLTMPRWVKSDLKEFKTPKAKAYFIRKKEGYIGSFNKHLRESSDYILKANKHLKELNKLLTTSSFYFRNTASINDIHLFASLRSLSIVDGIDFPKKVISYMKNQEELTKIPLHFNIAL